MRSVESIIFALFGLVSALLFHVGVYFPVSLSVAILFFVSLYLFLQYRRNEIGMLTLLIWLVYVLPFIHIPPYIFFDFSRNPLLLWGLAVNPYMVDERVIMLTAMIGAVGGMGIVLGTSLNRRRLQQDTGINPDGSKRQFRTIPMPIWLVWVAIGVSLTVLSAPQETIFTAEYTQSKSALDDANFSSAWMMSYVILSFAFCDALLERRKAVKHLKRKIIFATVILIVFFFQLMRGDRESVPWLFGLVLVYYYWAAGITQRRGFTIPWSRIASATFILIAISMVLGAIRSGLSGASLADVGSLIAELYESDTIGLANALHGTWSAVLLTPLSVAGDHIYGLLSIKWGQDYINLILSIIPGFFADAIGYIRPIDSGQGPAWEMRYGLGGTHAAVVPFMNFRMFGVFLVPALWAFVIVNTEKKALKKVDVVNLSLLVVITMASPHWLWYGEKNGINAIILWLIFAFFYRVSITFSRTVAAPRSLIQASPHT